MKIAAIFFNFIYIFKVGKIRCGGHLNLPFQTVFPRLFFQCYYETLLKCNKTYNTPFYPISLKDSPFILEQK